jgi:hypothetical protein
MSVDKRQHGGEILTMQVGTHLRSQLGVCRCNCLYRCARFVLIFILFSFFYFSFLLVVREVGTMANWIGRQYHLLQNSNCDVHTPFQRHTHFRRSASAAAASSSSSNGGGGDPNSPTAANAWTPRVVSIDASVGLDGVVATYGAQESGGSAQDRALQQYKRQQQQQQQGGESSSSSSSTPSSSRPSHWRDLGGPSLLPYHSKSLYSVPGLYEGTSDFHLFEQGSDVFAREAVVEEVLDRARWFLEECDRPDGIHVLVEANSGWAGAGASLLAHLRDDYGTSMPIFCVSAFTPPPPSSALQGGTFASATPLTQAMLNQALLLSAAAQNATAVLPLSTHYWPTATASAASSGAAAAAGSDASAAAASSPLADIVPASVLRALHAGEYFESGSLLALQLHWATACYRLYPRTDNMATTLQALTQGTSANILSARWIGGQALQDFLDPDAGGADGSPDSESNGGRQQQYGRGGGGGERESSLSEAMLRRAQPVHTAAKSVPLSLVGHGHAYAGSKPRALNNVASSSGYGAAAAPRSCDRNNGLLESVHVFGNTETLSHAQVRARMADFGTATGGSSAAASSSSSSSSAQAQGQPPAMWRSVSGSTRLNHPPSFPQSFGDLLTEGSATSLYRCGGAGVELRRLGTWLTSINRGTTITGSYNAARDEDEEDEDDGAHHARQQGDGNDDGGDDRPNDPTPRLLLSAAHRARRARQAALSLRNAQTDRDRPDDLHLSLTNQQVEELSEAGVTLQNLAESYY